MPPTLRGEKEEPDFILLSTWSVEKKKSYIMVMLLHMCLCNSIEMQKNIVGVT